MTKSINNLVITFIWIGMVTFVSNSYAQPNAASADSILLRVRDKVRSCSTLRYHYFRSINYFSEDYHSEANGYTYIDFRDPDSILGCRYQLENEKYKMVFNGSEAFHISKSDKTIKLHNKPKDSDFASLSLFLNSMLTLRKMLDKIIADASIPKSAADTVIDGTAYHLLKFILRNRTLRSTGGFDSTTLSRTFFYTIVVDKSSNWPVSVVQRNDAEPKDYMLTRFTEIQPDASDPPELSWYGSTYLADYKRVSKDSTQLIGEGSLAPAWRLKIFGDTGHLELGDLKGRLVILKFWQKNCGYCIAAIPRLNDLARKYKEKGVTLIGVNAFDSEAAISNFYRRTNPEFPSVLDLDGKMTASYGVTAFPTIVLIDGFGKVLYAGNLNEDKLRRLIEN
jgi:thiol-disulfide isomerase/thioredoxin